MPETNPDTATFADVLRARAGDHRTALLFEDSSWTWDEVVRESAQRAALLQLAWDHVGSALDHREHVFELHANGGTTTWRGRLRRRFDRYNELANAVTKHAGSAMPDVNLDSIRDAPLAARRPVNPLAPPKPR